ncbi:YHYH domain-containing protein [uncultured Clostridium sp.]|uniref:YHYH domain-containing protein n=1 Tax=uncultured Clostridium sp. TaxID=59620 RepID=UPI0037DC3E20
MSNRKHKRLLVMIFTVVLNFTIVANSVYAHSGRTDSSGGHRDNKNASGLGSYHYHHGYDAHLHSNGVCPYESNSNSLTTSPEKETISKAKVRESGYEKGYDDGYNQKQISSSSYSGEHAEEYKSEYNLGYERGKKQIENQIAEAHDKGYKDGKNADKSNNYKIELLTKSYNEGYEKGYKDYKDNKIKEYSLLGEKDGKAEKEILAFEDNIDSDFKNAYMEGYKKGQAVLEDTYVQYGFNKVFTGKEDKNLSLEKEKCLQWFNKGQKEGNKKLEELKKNFYELGYNSEEYNVPEELTIASDICKEYYEKGKADKRKKNILSGSIVGGGILGAIFIKRKR